MGQSHFHCQIRVQSGRQRAANLYFSKVRRIKGYRNVTCVNMGRSHFHCQIQVQSGLQRAANSYFSKMRRIKGCRDNTCVFVGRSHFHCQIRVQSRLQRAANIYKPCAMFASKQKTLAILAQAPHVTRLRLRSPMAPG